MCAENNNNSSSSQPPNNNDDKNDDDEEYKSYGKHSKRQRSCCQSSNSNIKASTSSTYATITQVETKRFAAADETRTKTSSSYIAKSRHRTTGFKWKIILPTIIFLLCQTSHVLAIRKGRLMTPSTFTALSGDLHVQIQFSGSQQQTTAVPTDTDDNGEESDAIAGIGGMTVESTATKSTTSSSSRTPTVTASSFTTTTTTSSARRGIKEVEKIITSTLVISKYIDDGYDVGEDGTAGVAGSSVSSINTETATADALPIDTNVGVTNSIPPSPTKTDNERRVILQRRRKEIVQNIPVYPDPRNNVTQIAVPCQTFMRGGLYEMQVVTNLKTTTAIAPSKNMTSNEVTTPAIVQTTTTLVPVSDERLRQTLDVRWPSAEMRVSPVRLRTYPEAPVEVELRFPEVNCERAWHSSDLPEFWLELIYCGKERTCTQLPPQNVSKSNILYAEQVRGYPKQKLLKLGCELFGLAGNYAVQLRPMVPAPGVPITRRFLSVDWSDKFVFNVYARSIFPCDPHTGIGVLYEYPACILEQGDRVRVYAKLRADVASLKPPTSLHYVAEQRVVKSQYSLYFSCELFTEKYVEYCFVYVSQAISGAVADVRMDCVPTLPVSDSDTGGWGPWSEWTPCSTNCLGGTRNRYRFCDSPPPRYGAKFCEGPFVETEKCGQQSVADTWDCLYETSYGSVNSPNSNNNYNNLHKANRTEVSQEIGPGCRCGCIVHLGAAKPKRYIAGATQSCPGRSFWLIQVDGVEIISLSLDFLRLPCAAQYIKVRDGPSLSSTLLVELNGGNNLNMGIAPPATTQLESTGAQLLVEFYAGGGEEAANSAGVRNKSDNDAANNMDPTCTGGFLANVEQMVKNTTGAATTLMAATRLSPNAVKSRAMTAKTQRLRNGFTLVHLSAVIFASIIILISAMLGAQYVVRYRKYHLAVARRRDEGSRLHTPHASLSSLQSPPSRAMSTTTLLSEVIYLVKMRPKHQLRHSILRESVDAENLALARETDFNEEHIGLGHVTLNKCAEEMGSNGSIVTLRNELITSTPIELNVPLQSAEHLGGKSISRTPSETGLATADVDVSSSPSGTLTRKDSAKDSESIISSGMSSICNSPPMNAHRFSKYSDRYDAVTLKVRHSRYEDSRASTSSSTMHHDSDASLRSSLQQLGARSASTSLTNVSNRRIGIRPHNVMSAFSKQGCYSPAVSIVSTATIRTTNPKESKDKQNRKKLLARPGSEFSLGNQEELELDYYDYNVINAGAAPGSYLGMDPAYLIWIPPFEELTPNAEGAMSNDSGDGGVDARKTPEPNATVLTEEPNATGLLYEDIKMPKYGHYLSPGSNSESTTNTTNTTTPTSDEISPLSSNLQSKVTTPCETHLKNSLIQQVISCATGSGGGVSIVCNKPATPYMSRKQKRAAKQQSKSAHALGHQETIPMLELSATKSARNITSTTAGMTTTTPITTIASTSSSSSLNTQPMCGSYIEKETEVVKSPDLQNFLALDDIEFADESESNDFYDGSARNTLKTKCITGNMVKDEVAKKSMQHEITKQQCHSEMSNLENRVKELEA